MELDVGPDTHRRLVNLLHINQKFVAIFGLIFASLCCTGSASAQTQIHKCTNADGVVAYSQLPCVSQEPVEPKTEELDKTTEVEATPLLSEEQPLAATEPQQEESETQTDRSACRKRYRDAIDAIDAEIGRDYSPEKAEAYKQRLLPLTRKLRQC